MDRKNVYDVLEERGFLDQATYADELKELLAKESLVFYVGFDVTADSLTLGHYLVIMAMRHMQNAGHVPIALIGSGTTRIGDPTGRTDMRQLLTNETLDKNELAFKKQLASFLDFSEDKAYFDNNQNWLLDLNFVDFIKEIGVHFSVNRMLSFDCYKNRMEQGLTFFEFSYMLMQSYDFLYLYRKYNCRLQMGGSDQWSNMLGGSELVNKLEHDKVFSLTLKLLSTADGVKMGKTMKGALWLDKEKTSPYELFQYLRNVDDRDVEKFLALLTFLPMDTVRSLGALEGSEINKAKEVLAYEVCKDIHGKEEADKSLEASKALFSGAAVSDNIPSSDFTKEDFKDGIGILSLLTQLGLTSSNGEARRLITQKGLAMDDVIVDDPSRTIELKDFVDGKILFRKGKKVYHQIKLV